MILSEAKKLYESLKENGILDSRMTGKWEKDKALFLAEYEENEKTITDSFGILDLDEDNDFGDY